ASYYARRVRRDGIQHLHGTFGTRTTTLAHLTALLSSTDYSFTTHAYDIFRPNPSLAWQTNAARFIRTLSHFNKSYIEEVYRGIEPSRIQVVYLGVDTVKFSPCRANPNVNGRLRIVSVGDLVEKKGHIFLIRACALLARQGYQFTCSIIGEGEQRSRIEEEVAQLGMASHVNLLGSLAHEDVRKELNESHLFVLGCIDVRAKGEDLDGIPVALMEAMALGMPAVSTAISGVPELIEDG